MGMPAPAVVVAPFMPAGRAAVGGVGRKARVTMRPNATRRGPAFIQGALEDTWSGETLRLALIAPLRPYSR
jgi:hypothetical protein